MPLWQLKDKRVSVDRKENIQSSHLDPAAWTTLEQSPAEKRWYYKGSVGWISWAQAGWVGSCGSVGSRCVLRSCTLLPSPRPAHCLCGNCISLRAWILQQAFSDLTACRQCLQKLQNDGFLRSPWAFGGFCQAALHISQEWVVRHKDACTSKSADWAPWNPISCC